MDIAEVRMTKQNLENELNGFLAEPLKYQKEITATRGRLLRTLYKEYRLETDPVVKDAIQDEIRTQLQLHKVQLNGRIQRQDVKGSAVKQISEELGLKFRKVCSSIKQVKYAKSKKEKSANRLNVVGNALSMAGTVVKVPVVTALKLGGALSPFVGKLVVCPLHIPAYLFSKIIDPDKKYTGQGIDNMGQTLGDSLNNILKLTEQGVRKI